MIIKTIPPSCDFEEFALAKRLFFYYNIGKAKMEALFTGLKGKTNI